jgi:signal transduction histidine kinase
MRPRAARPKAAGEPEDGSRAPTFLRSIRTRLAVIFFLITLLAVAVMYVVIGPPLNSALQTQRLNDLQEIAKPYAVGDFAHWDGLSYHDPEWKKTVHDATHLATHASASTLSQTSVFDVQLNTTGTAESVPRLLASSPGAPTDDVASFASAVAGNGGDPLQSTINSSVGPLGVVGYVVWENKDKTVSRVAVFSVPMKDLVPAASLVRSRLLFAALIALAVALLTGVLVAHALTVRVTRLKSTAQSVAAGNFDEHFSDSSGDEIGQLAAALAHMQSQLEDVEDSRRRFIATASHELRTPIFSLGGFLELIQDEDLDDETRRQFVGQVREQVDRLGKLATQLLDLSRLESGSVKLAPAPTDLGVLARAVSAEFVPAVAQHSSRLDVQVPDEPVRATCDPERVAQLLRILIDNALNHTDAGTAVVVAVAPPNGHPGASLSVQDQGTGIPPAALERIFEPFYSADGARGAGLGLAIARELSLQMGARLEVASEPGDTTFTLLLAADMAETSSENTA